MRYAQITMRLISIVVLNLVISFFFASMADVGCKLLFYNNLKLGTPTFFIKFWLIFFIVFMTVALIMLGLYNINKTLWDSIHENREKIQLLKLAPDVKAFADFYWDFGDYLFHIEKD